MLIHQGVASMGYGLKALLKTVCMGWVDISSLKKIICNSKKNRFRSKSTLLHELKRFVNS